MIKSIVFDVGETITRDDRYWATWADWLHIPRHTVSALVGAVVAQGRDNADALRLIRPDIDIAAERAAMETAGRGEHLDESDLYPDVRPALTALRAAGVRVYVAGNQTVRAGELLRELDLPVDGLAVSGEWGVAKPDPAFFARVVEMTQAQPGDVLYVGDHPDNDVFPARAAGLRTAHIRRGPWGYYWADEPAVVEAAGWRIDSLTQLTTIVAG